ncbi:MAG: hypothetical protein V1679_00325 [Candidatus Peregrinibacteria bacterium]
MPNSFKYRLSKLPVMKKLILLGSFLAIIGVFLPWYQDIDKFKTGDMFLGITGPLYLAGLIVLLGGVASFGLILLKLLNKPAPKLPMKEDHFHVFTSVISLFMLVFAVSVFFHYKFGIGLVDKSVGIGMILDFIGFGMVLIGSIMTIRMGEVSFEEEGSLEPLISVDEDVREAKSLERDDRDVRKSVQESIEDFSEHINSEVNDD